MSISTEQVLVVIGCASTIATSLFWGAIYLGRLTARLERVEGRIEGHDTDINELGRLLRAAALKP